MQLNIRDGEVQRLNARIKQLQSEIRDLRSQLDVSVDKVSVDIDNIFEFIKFMQNLQFYFRKLCLYYQLYIQ
jgi:prefoldin subunit 5